MSAHIVSVCMSGILWYYYLVSENAIAKLLIHMNIGATVAAIIL